MILKDFFAIDQVFLSIFRPKIPMDATDFFEIKNGQMENTNHHILTFLTFFLYPSLLFNLNIIRPSPKK